MALSEAFVQGIIVAAIAVIPAVLVLRNSRKVDEKADEVGEETRTWERQSTLIEQLSEDNKDVRERVMILDERAGSLDVRLNKSLDELADCLESRKEVHERLTVLETKYGIQP